MALPAVQPRPLPRAYVKRWAVTEDEGAFPHRPSGKPGTVADRSPWLPFAPLNDRETQVLRPVAEGHPNKTIGRALLASERTVKAHLAAAFRKLGADNRAPAATLALRLGLASQHAFVAGRSPCWSTAPGARGESRWAAAIPVSPVMSGRS